MPSTNYYEILEVSPDASPEVIRAAYRSLSGKYHPDKDTSPEGRQKFQQIQDANDVLSDPVRRQEYDSTLGNGGHRPPNEESKVFKEEDLGGRIMLGVVCFLVFGLMLVAASGSNNTSAKDTSLSGLWRTNRGDTLKLNHNGDRLSLTVVNSLSMNSGNASLEKSGSSFRGTMNADFGGIGGQRSGEIELRKTGTDSISGTTDHVKWNRYGRETFREKVAVYLTRI